MRDINNFVLEGGVNLQLFECPCCHTVKISAKLVRIYVEIRKLIPVVITSAYRCSKHIGDLDFRHAQGLALDLHPVRITDSDATVVNLFNLVSTMPDIKGIGLHPQRVHIDLRGGKRLYWVRLPGQDQKYYRDKDRALEYFVSGLSAQ